MALPPALIAKFVAHLAALHAEVAGLQAAITAGGEGADDQRERLRAIAHQLAGTAEPYGFADLGVQARRLEESLSHPAGAPTPPAEVQPFADALDAAARSGAA